MTEPETEQMIALPIKTLSNLALMDLTAALAAAITTTSRVEVVRDPLKEHLERKP